MKTYNNHPKLQNRDQHETILMRTRSFRRRKLSLCANSDILPHATQNIRSAKNSIHVYIAHSRIKQTLERAISQWETKSTKRTQSILSQKRTQNKEIWNINKQRRMKCDDKFHFVQISKRTKLPSQFQKQRVDSTWIPRKKYAKIQEKFLPQNMVTIWQKSYKIRTAWAR